MQSVVKQNRFSKNQSKPRLAFMCPTRQLTIDQHYRTKKEFIICLTGNTQKAQKQKSSHAL